LGFEAPCRKSIGRYGSYNAHWSGASQYRIRSKNDLTAVFLTISSITGMATLLFLRARRRSGFIVGGLSAAVILAIYWIWAPR
jgi:hypothetical protein